MEPADDLERRRIDHVDVARLHVRHVDARQRAARPLRSSSLRQRRCRDSRGRAPAACPDTVATGRAALAREGSRRGACERRQRDERSETRRARRGRKWTFKTKAPRKSPHANVRVAANDDTLIAARRRARSRRACGRRSASSPARPAATLARRGSPCTPSAGPSALPSCRRALRTSRSSTASDSAVSAAPACDADLGVAEAELRAAPRRIRARRRGSTPRPRARAPTSCRPLAVEPGGDPGEALLVAAVVADQDDVAKAVPAKAARGVFDRRLERRLRDADRSGEAHVPGRRIDAAFGHVGDRPARRARCRGSRRSARRAPGRARCACRGRCAARSARCRRPAR